MGLGELILSFRSNSSVLVHPCEVLAQEFKMPGLEKDAVDGSPVGRDGMDGMGMGLGQLILCFRSNPSILVHPCKVQGRRKM